MRATSEIDWNFLENKFTQIEETRDNIIKLSRDIVRIAGKIVSLVHAGKIEDASFLLEELQNLKSRFCTICADILNHIYGIYKNTLQEYVEAYLFYSYVVEGKVPDWKTLDVPEDIWLYGFLDFMGELTRYIYELLISGRQRDAFKAMDFFFKKFREVEIFGKFKFPEGIRSKIDGLRRKYEEFHRLLINYRETCNEL